MTALLFDLDDTLFDLSTPQFLAMKKIYKGKLPPLTNEHFMAFRKYSDERFIESQKGLISMEEMYIYRIRMTLSDLGISTSDKDALLFQEAYLTYQKQITLTPAIEQMLQFLNSRHVLIGLITNGSKEHQMDKVRALHLLNYIPKNHMFFSGELNCAKPDPKIFTHVANILNLQNEVKYYIGDTFENDIVASKKASFHAIWYNRRHYSIRNAPVMPDDTVYSDEELSILVQKLILNN